MFAGHVGFPAQRLGTIARAATARTNLRPADCFARPTAARPGPKSRRRRTKVFRRNPTAGSRSRSRPRMRSAFIAFVESPNSALFVSDDGGATWEQARQEPVDGLASVLFREPDCRSEKSGSRLQDRRRADPERRRRQKFFHGRRFQRRARRRARCLDRSDQSANRRSRRRRRDVVFLQRRQQMVESATTCRSRSFITSAWTTPIRIGSTAGCRTTARGSATREYPGGITNHAVGKHVQRRRLLDVSRSGRSRLHLRRISGRQHRTGQSSHPRSAQHSADAELQGKAALQLEHADRAFA